MSSSVESSAKWSADRRGGLSGDEFERLARVGEAVTLESGQVFFRRGDESDALYLIERGAVVLDFGEGKNKKTLGPGELFGELFLGQGSLRTADAIAQGATAVRRIDFNHVEVLKEEQPRLLCSLLQGTCATLLASETELVKDLRRRNRELEDAFDFLQRTHRKLDREAMLARTDDTTGLYNKRCLNEQFPDFAARAQSAGCSLTLMWIDLDDFKRVNDLSYEAGDATLHDIASILRRAVGPLDLPCRWGGDEFCVLMPAVGRGLGASEALRLHAAISGKVIPPEGEAVAIRLSIGGAELAPDDSFEDLRSRANQSLLLAKKSGKDCVVWEGRILAEDR